MECMQLRSPPGPFHYLISEQAKSLVALQELQNEVGALLEFRDLVIETFPNLRSKMAPSTPAGGARREWEPGVRVRRKLANGGDARKPQPSVQDSGFSTETSCGKDAHSSASAASAPAARARPLEDELWALLDVIQRKGGRLRDEAELLRAELDERPAGPGELAEPAGDAEAAFARQLGAGCASCGDAALLRAERDALLAAAARAAAARALPSAAVASVSAPAPLGRLDAALQTPPRPPRVPSLDPKKISAILLETNPVELQRQLLVATVQNQALGEAARRAARARATLLARLARADDLADDLKFRLEEKNIELEGARARVRQLEGRRAGGDGSLERRSMRGLEPLPLPDADTPQRRPSRIPLHTAHKGAAPRPPAPPAPAPQPASQPARPPSAHSVRSVRSAGGPRREGPASGPRKEPKPPARRSPPAPAPAPDNKRSEAALAEYVSRAGRLAPLLPRLRPLPADLLAYESPQNLARELEKSILYENGAADSLAAPSLGGEALWRGRPQHYFESMNYAEQNEDSRPSPPPLPT